MSLKRVGKGVEGGWREDGGGGGGEGRFSEWCKSRVKK